MTEYVVLLVGDGDRSWTTMTEQEREDGYAEMDVSPSTSPSAATASSVAPSCRRHHGPAPSRPAALR